MNIREKYVGDGSLEYHVVEQQMLRGCGWSTALDRRRVEAGRWRRLIGVTRDHAVRRSLASRQGMSFPSTHQDGSFPLAEPLQLAEPRLESALQLDVTHMQFHLEGITICVAFD